MRRAPARSARRGALAALALLAAALAQPAMAQTPLAGETPPVEAQTPAPAPETAPETEPGAPPAVDPMEEPSADASSPRRLRLEPRPVAYLEGTALWDDNFEVMRKARETMEAELARLGIAPTGPMLGVYLETTDESFTYVAMQPVAETREEVLPDGFTIRFTRSPAGEALVFESEGAFDEVDSLYEAIAAYLDEKRLTMRTPYFEEYLSPLADPADPAFRMNIYIILDESRPPPPEPATPDPAIPAPETPGLPPDPAAPLEPGAAPESGPSAFPAPAPQINGLPPIFDPRTVSPQAAPPLSGATPVAPVEAPQGGSPGPGARPAAPPQ
jgi:predicted transcriptional regulator YdeE